MFSDSGQEVFHLTVNAEENSHETSTVVGQFRFQQNDGVAFIGKFTAWDGENVNSNNAVLSRIKRRLQRTMAARG